MSRYYISIYQQQFRNVTFKSIICNGNKVTKYLGLNSTTVCKTYMHKIFKFPRKRLKVLNKWREMFMDGETCKDNSFS